MCVRSLLIAAFYVTVISCESEDDWNESRLQLPTAEGIESNPFRQGGEEGGCSPHSEGCYDDTSRRRSWCVTYAIPDCEGCRGRRRVTPYYVANRRRACRTLPESAEECAARKCQDSSDDSSPTTPPPPAKPSPTPPPTATETCKDKTKQCCASWFKNLQSDYCKQNYWRQQCPNECA